MSFQLKRSEKIQTGIRRIAKEQIEKAIDEIDDESADPHFTVHQVRKRCKKLRGLTRLVGPALGKKYKTGNDAFRDAAEPLSRMRDASTIIGTFDSVINHFESRSQPESFDSIRNGLQKRLAEITDNEIKHRFADVRKAFVESLDEVEQWKLATSGFKAIDDGVLKTHRRAQLCLAEVLDEPKIEALHQLRKHVKYHWYHARLLRGIWPAMMHHYAVTLKDLGEALGDDHDLAVLGKTVADSRDEFGSKVDIDSFMGLLLHRRAKTSASAIGEARRVFAEPTPALMKRLKAYWKLWR